MLRDLDRGLVDFPSLRDGREIYLCWEEGEDEIGFWHEPDAGFGAGRAAPLGRWLSSLAAAELRAARGRRRRRCC